MKVVLDDGAYEPMRAHPTDAGLDLRSPVDVFVPNGGSAVIDTGVHVELPHGTVGLLKSISGLNIMAGIVSEGVIDEGYTGSIRVKLYNHTNNFCYGGYHVRKGDRISQLVVIECLFPDVEIVDSLDETDRGDNGFGSTGK